MLLFNGFTFIDKKLKSSFESLIYNYRNSHTLEEIDVCDFLYYNLIYSSEKVSQNQQLIMKHHLKPNDQNILINESSQPPLRKLAIDVKIDLCRGLL